MSDMESHWRQIMQNGWYPVTTKDPQSCTTFECLDNFRLLNILVNVNVRDYVSVLEQSTDPMSRQWAYLKQLRRAGIGHLEDGLQSAEEGSVAVQCWACPQEGVNLPPDWEKVPEKEQYLFRLFVGMDANFCMKSRLRQWNKHKQDCPLYEGLGYQVLPKPYFEHLRNHVKEVDISTCVAFAALMQKETKMSTGLRCTGVGACVCTRHELIRPTGVGDLLKGERYANMDFVFWSALKGVWLKQVMLSYDIGCQYKINLNERWKKLPKDLQLQTDSGEAFIRLNIDVALPVWHGNDHELSCRTLYLLKYKEGSGKMDREGVKWVWPDLNQMAMQTKEMHPEVRHDALEDKGDRHNFRKNIGLGYILDRRLKLVLEESNIQDKAFDDIDSTLKEDLHAEWAAVIDAWKHNNTQPNPYMSRSKAKATVSEAEVRLKLHQDELAELAKGAQAVKGKSVTAFLTAALELEDMQYMILFTGFNTHSKWREQCPRASSGILQKAERVSGTAKDIMPRVMALIEEEEFHHDAEQVAPKAEEVRLWLPSHVPESERVFVCDNDLFDMEFQLREGQCTDALASLCTRLFTKQHLMKYWNNNVTGQYMSTRARTMIQSIGNRIKAAAAKYHRAQAAMKDLRGEEACGQFRALEKDDVAPVQEAESDDKVTRKLGRLGDRESHSQKSKLSKKDMFWIWTESGGPEDDDMVLLHESVHVEWSKALARHDQWREEVKLLREEMRRVLQSLRWEALEWHRLAEQDYTNVGEEL
ncbi:hypothetical protein ARMSODRAFT_1024951 [Armillaria solidipes]|uniref:CxC2-like cysteine cluster KDZ transposase-associated domain-containing protein n=1 Tax=Armillaria solidipes TaxID=1076256 RepID=A0A2H3AXV0_9AGAR|nr:hypothetical protein ARMSODRAFT_1024951 [Armillaria solidipes]